jgi:hypothetical protein
MKNSNPFKQYNVKGIGAFINVLYAALPIFGIATSIMEAGTFYGVQRVNIYRFAPWLSFEWFLAFVILLGLIIVAVFYKFIYPSYFAFINKQTYIHQNPMQQDLEQLKEDMKLIKDHFKIGDDKGENDELFK